METLALALLVAVASFVGTVSGFGTSTIMVPVLLFFFPLPVTLLFAGIIHWSVDIWKVALFREGLRWRLIMLFGAPGVLATFFAVQLVFEVPEILLSRVLGAFLIGYVGLLLLKPRLKLPKTSGTALAGGVLSGFFAGIFGIGGAVRGAFLSLFDLPKAVYLATSGAIGFAVDSTRVGAYISGGATLPSHLFWGLFLFVPASLLGAVLAKGIVEKVPQKYFRLLVAVFLLLVGFRLLVFA
ncbi:MAG: sulfite exporter TauE/SafE family protein [Candidatus Yanofskybacteria bacterium]|nr:sulfite exporter TauE/SafE family protein [Candidatus Yanofskybacteria bacterium]